MTPEEREKRLVVRAGLFVALALTLGGVVIFLIGKERNLFDRQVAYTGAFENVDGLQLDAPVQLGGLRVGSISKISFAPDLGDKRIIVTMQVASRFKERIRRDSVARVTSRGLLGDKAIDISLGSPEAEVVADGSELVTGTSGDVSSLLKATGEIVDNAVTITRDLRTGVAAYTDPELRKDVAVLVKSARNVAEAVETGQGILHVLAYDRRAGDDFKGLMSGAAASAVRLESAIGQAEKLLEDARTQDGTVHALIYDQKIAKAFTELGQAAEEVAAIVHDAKNTKEGAVYQLVYGDARTLLGDLSKSAADLKTITAKIRAGEGSVGGLISDPSVYEDLKEIMGNVKRNRVLRELVRFSISNGENLDRTGKPEEKPEPKK